MKLSIIIPAFNNEPYLGELIATLRPQATADTEIIIIDDGSKDPVKHYEGATVYRQENGGVSAARNAGIGRAQGDFIAFIDADDQVAPDYIATILQTIEEQEPDYIYLSWRTIPGGGWSYSVKLESVADKFPPWNLCCWNRIYKRDMIGAVRFNENKIIAEDAQFIRDVKETGKKKAIINRFMYYYRDNPESLTKRFNNGELDARRVVYYYEHVTADMRWLIAEAAELDKTAEVMVMTWQNDLPELENHAMVMQPTSVRCTEARGEHTGYINIIQPPIKTQVVLYVSGLQGIGGIETFIYNFCYKLRKYYDIMVLYDAEIPGDQRWRLSKLVPVVRNTERVIICNTAINIRIVKELPRNIRAKKTIQMCHTCKMEQGNQLTVPHNKDLTIYVSQTAADSFGDTEGTVVHNLTIPDAPEPLLLISATRQTPEKGIERMKRLAQKINAAGIEYTWLYFSYHPIPDAPKNMIHIPPTMNIKPYLRAASYLVQLSDTEAFCYSIVEALEVGTPVITTPLPVLEELGVKDGENAYIIPWEVEGFDARKLKKIPEFKYKNDNARILKQWREILGNTKPVGGYQEPQGIDVIITMDYYDVELGRNVTKGERLTMALERAQYIESKGGCKCI